MAWHDGLTDEQRTAAGHAGHHARMLAGPGTGKTYVLTRRIVFLVEEMGVDPEEIYALTFTRAAALELRQRVATALPDVPSPRISTLHSFALRQLLRNANRIEALPRPLRIADDWEERNIILEDLKAALGLRKINDAKELFDRLAADWESLAVDAPDWDPDPAFLGAWREHRARYGYTLRSELVYQLKRCLEQQADFMLDTPIRHLLVDEYQDLNRCDLAVIRAIVNRGAELFVAGDDDQSIYGFRKAHPDGIRNFHAEYQGARDLALEVCQRCDSNILALSDFVAMLDPRRLPKTLRPAEGREGGEVVLLQCTNQNNEAEGIAEICEHLVTRKGIAPGSILVLLRSDRNRAFSSIIEAALHGRGLPVSSGAARSSPLDEQFGRKVLSLLRLSVSRDDDLAWRTLIALRRNGVGTGALVGLDDLARTRNERFSQTLDAVYRAPAILPRFGSRIQAEVQYILDLLDQIALIEDELEAGSLEFSEAIIRLTPGVLDDGEDANDVQEHLSSLIRKYGLTNLTALVDALSVSSEDIEQELQPEQINIMTMHRAKGLTADAVFIVGVEDEAIPGRQLAEAEIGDERRLLYVSLTRARHHLLLTYCTHRYGQQAQTGRNPGNPRRHLTRFLTDAKLRPVPMNTYLAGIQRQPV